MMPCHTLIDMLWSSVCIDLSEHAIWVIDSYTYAACRVKSISSGWQW